MLELEFIILVIAGFLTATLSGFVGMGGGMALLGVMTTILPAPHVVPLHGVVQLCSNTTRTFAFLKHVRWRIFGIYFLPSAIGLGCATMLWSGDKLDWFKPAIGLFILVFLFWRKRTPKLRNFPLWWYAPLGLVVGFLAIFVGAIGPFIAPFFLRDDFDKENVIATKAMCQLWVHAWKIPAFLSLGFDYGPHTILLVALFVAVVAGTYFGKALLGRMSEAFFLRIFQGILGVIAVYLMGSIWW